MTVKFSQLRKVRSLAKKTLGSTRVGRAMRLPVKIGSAIGMDGRGVVRGWSTWSCLEEWLARHFCYVGAELWRELEWTVQTLVEEAVGLIGFAPEW